MSTHQHSPPRSSIKPGTRWGRHPKHSYTPCRLKYILLTRNEWKNDRLTRNGRRNDSPKAGGGTTHSKRVEERPAHQNRVGERLARNEWKHSLETSGKLTRKRMDSPKAGGGAAHSKRVEILTQSRWKNNSLENEWTHPKRAEERHATPLSGRQLFKIRSPIGWTRK